MPVSPGRTRPLNEGSTGEVLQLGCAHGPRRDPGPSMKAAPGRCCNLTFNGQTTAALAPQ